MKKTTKIISILISCIMVLAVLVPLAGCGMGADDGEKGKKEAKKMSYTYPDDVKSEYWGVSYVAFPGRLKKTQVNEYGDVLAVRYFNPLNHLNDFSSSFELGYELYNYDENGRLTSSVMYIYEYNGIYDEVAKSYETVYCYDGDRIVSSRVYVNGVKTRRYDEYEYAEDGSLKCVRVYEEDKPYVTCNYNGKSLPESIDLHVSVEGFCSYGYGIYRLIKEQGDARVFFTYDENNNLVGFGPQETADWVNSCRIGYEDGMPIRIDQEYCDALFTGCEPNGKYERKERSVTFAYSDDGRLEVMDYGGNIYSYFYDDEGRVTGAYVDREYDSNTLVKYDSAGRIVDVEYKHALRSGGEETVKKTALGFTEDGRLLGYTKVITWGDNETVETVTYTYDEDGNRTSKAVNGEREYIREYYPNGMEKSYKWKNRWYLYSENGNLREERNYDESRPGYYRRTLYDEVEEYYVFRRCGNLTWRSELAHYDPNSWYTDFNKGTIDK